MVATMTPARVRRWRWFSLETHWRQFGLGIAVECCRVTGWSAQLVLGPWELWWEQRL
jgi:hypothetical protein